MSETLNAIESLIPREIYRCYTCLDQCFFQIEEVQVKYINSKKSTTVNHVKIINHDSCQVARFDLLKKVNKVEELLEL